MIIGIKEEDKVVLAYASFDAFYPVICDDMKNAENVGIWKVKGNRHTVMGCMTPSAESDALRYEEKLLKGEITYGRLSDDVLPAIEEFVKDKEYIGDDKDRYEEFLIAQKGSLFHITSEHVIVEIDSFIALSCVGEDLAMGVLYATEGQPTEDRLRKAFEFVARERQCECYPVSIIDTATGKLRTLGKPRN